MTLDVICDRVRSLLVTDGYVEASTPFTFDQQPTGEIDGVVRVVSRSQGVIGGFRFTEERTDQVQIWAARKFASDPTSTHRTLVQDMHSITAAIVRDGEQDGGDYSVPDAGRYHEIRADKGAAFGVLQLTVPVNYEAQL